jgi:secreted trypsin-like serine protease
MASLRTLWISLLAALMLAAAPTASAIVDGSVDVERDYVVFVGQQVVVPGGPTVNTVACSGVLVAPTVVVTAAHCSLMGPPVPPSWIHWVVIRGQGIRTPDAVQVSGRFVVHPGFCIGCPGAPEGFANNDLAVVLLDSPLPGPYAKLPKADFVGKHFDKEKQLVAAGYGITGPGLRDVGTRRSAQAGAVVAPNAANFLLLPVPSKQKYGTACAGDSGGAALLGTMVVAVHSIGDDQCGGPSYAYRLDTPDAQSFLSNYLDVRG